jgi:Sec-independent protein translocase protein TatA
MLTWILIALIIALIFGVVKVEDCKANLMKLVALAKKWLMIAFEWLNTQTTEIKKKLAAKQAVAAAKKEADAKAKQKETSSKEETSAEDNK